MASKATAPTAIPAMAPELSPFGAALEGEGAVMLVLPVGALGLDVEPVDVAKPPFVNVVVVLTTGADVTTSSTLCAASIAA